MGSVVKLTITMFVVWTAAAYFTSVLNSHILSVMCGIAAGCHACDIFDHFIDRTEEL